MDGSQVQGTSKQEEIVLTHTEAQKSQGVQ